MTLFFRVVKSKLGTADDYTNLFWIDLYRQHFRSQYGHAFLLPLQPSWSVCVVDSAVIRSCKLPVRKLHRRSAQGSPAGVAQWPTSLRVRQRLWMNLRPETISDHTRLSRRVRLCNAVHIVITAQPACLTCDLATSSPAGGRGAVIIASTFSHFLCDKSYQYCTWICSSLWIRRPAI